jgi:hypothetical protein
MVFGWTKQLQDNEGMDIGCPERPIDPTAGPLKGTQDRSIILLTPGEHPLREVAVHLAAEGRISVGYYGLIWRPIQLVRALSSVK